MLVHQTKRHRTEHRICLELALDAGCVTSELGIVIEKADDVGHRVVDPDVTTTRNTAIRVGLDDASTYGWFDRPCTVADHHHATSIERTRQRSNRPTQCCWSSTGGEHDPVHPGERSGRCHGLGDDTGTLSAMSSATANLPPAGMRDAHEAAKLRPYLLELWSRRSYLWYVSANELRSRQITNVLGNLWHLLNPALTVAVYYLIFGLLLKTTRGVDNYILFLTIGLFLFQYTQSTTINGAKSIVNNKGLIRAIHFPKALLPITETVTESLASGSKLVVLVVVALLTQEPITWRWLMLPGVIALMFVFNLGAAMIAARLTTQFRDTTQILPFVFRLLLYASGVIFNVDAYTAENPTLQALFTLNPMYCFISLGRWCFMAGNLDLWLLVSAVVWSIALVIGGFFWFRAAEERYSRD